MRREIFVLSISILVLVSGAGCTKIQFETPTLEHLGMVGVIAFDYIDKEKARVTLSVPQPSSSTDIGTQIYTSVATMPFQSIMDISTESERILSTAQLRVLLFSEKYAREIGLREIIENVYRDPEVGNNVFIAVVKGSAEAILIQDYKDKPDVNKYLNDLLQPRIVTAFNPFTTIHQFLFRLTDEVSDPSVPYLELVKEGTVKISKVALFRGDKMIATLEAEEGKLVEGMKKRKELPALTITTVEKNEKGEAEEKMLLLKFVKSRYHTRVNGNPNAPKIYQSLNLEGTVADYNGFKDLSDPDERKEVEMAIEEELKKKTIAILHRFQELQIDPIGLGRAFRAKDKSPWSKEYWNEVYSRTDLTVHINVTIVSTGSIK